MNPSPKLNLLLVDDDRDYLELMAIQFTHEGFNVVRAYNEKEAFQILETMKPDLAIVDLMMDDLDGGFTLAHAIKKIDENIPVLIITGASAETGLVFEKSGTGEGNWIKADAVLAKPVRFEQILSELELLGVPHV